MKTIGVVTVGRSDYGIYLPLLHAIQAEVDLELYLIVGGMHLSPEFGRTIELIMADGFPIGVQVEFLLSSDRPEGISKSIGLGVLSYAQAYAQFQPDLLVVLGDRFEMYAAVLAALPFKIPVAHIHGGEVTQGAIDDSLRHSITKLSHLHFVSTEEYARRVRQMGEESWRVVVSGALSLDNLNRVELMGRGVFEARFGISLLEEFLLVTYHPVTLEYEQTEWQVTELLAALDEFGLPVLFTMPNADTGGRLIRKMIKDFVRTHPFSHHVENLGSQGYFSAMAMAKAMVGNSSSGIIEAPMFKLPVVNIGTRQRGRMRSINIIDTGYQRDAILHSIQRATSVEFSNELIQLVNPHGDGHAADRIVQALKRVECNDQLLFKEFVDFPEGSSF